MQGLDYIYTINGWQKGLNAGIQDSSKDAGADGLVGGLNQFIGKDVLTFALQYFHSDYKAISVAGNNSGLNISQSLSSFVPLYNGNIAGTMMWQDTLSPLARLYRYDALNRLKMQDGFEYNKNAGTFQPTNAWATRYAYDKMGNITFLLRNASANVQMDKLSYHYYSGKNQLSYVNDAVSASAFANDIDNQNKNNYQYDLIGNLIQDNSEKLKITWTHYRKVKQIDSIASTATTKLKFKYDALGNRLVKENVKTKTRDIYIRDAQGNIMALYQIKNDSLFAKEFYMYGSQRLGYIDENIFLAKKNSIFPVGNFSTLKKIAAPSNVNYTFGNKRYELNDWLGNVRVVISDKKIPVINGNIVTGYKADVRSVTDYYPFGSIIPGRNFSRENYRFGYGAHEKVNEISGAGNQIDMGARYLDTRLCRTSSPDPLGKNYPYVSPYAYALNTPLQAIDPDGKLVIFVNGLVKQQWLFHNNPALSSYGISGKLRPYPTYGISTSGSPQYLRKDFTYWEGIDQLFMQQFEDYNSVYINASDAATSQAADRYVAGLESGMQLIGKIQSGAITLAKDETIKIVGHSQGAAHAAGMASILNYAYQQGSIKNPVEQIYYLAPHQPTDFSTPEGIRAVQYSRKSDRVSSKGIISTKFISGGSTYGKIGGVKEMPPMPDMKEDLGGHYVETFNEIFYRFKMGEKGYVGKQIEEKKSPQSTK